MVQGAGGGDQDRRLGPGRGGGGGVREVRCALVDTSAGVWWLVIPWGRGVEPSGEGGERRALCCVVRVGVWGCVAWLRFVSRWVADAPLLNTPPPPSFFGVPCLTLLPTTPLNAFHWRKPTGCSREGAAVHFGSS